MRVRVQRSNCGEAGGVGFYLFSEKGRRRQQGREALVRR